MCLSITEPDRNDGPVELCYMSHCPVVLSNVRVAPGRIWASSLVMKEMSASPGCPSLPDGNRQGALGTDLGPLQPQSNALQEHLDSSEPCLRHLGTSRCVLLIKQPAGKQQRLGDVQLITGVTSSAPSKLWRKEAICKVPLAESSGTDRNYSNDISAALLLLVCRHTSGIMLAR